MLATFSEGPRDAWLAAVSAAVAVQTCDAALAAFVPASNRPLVDALWAARVRPELAAAALLNDPRAEVIAWRPAAAMPADDETVLIETGPVGGEPVGPGYWCPQRLRWHDPEGMPLPDGCVRHWALLPTGPVQDGEGVPC